MSFDTVIEKLKVFHRAAESVFDWIRGHSHPVIAVPVFIAAIWLLAFWSSLPERGSLAISDYLVVVNANFLTIMDGVSAKLSILLLMGLIITGGMWWLGPRLARKKKEQASWHVVFLLASIPLILFSLYPEISWWLESLGGPWGYLMWLWLGLTIYTGFVSLRVALGCTYKEVVGWMVIAYILFNVAQVVVLLTTPWGESSYSKENPTYFVFNVTRYKDGSIKVGDEWYFNKTNELAQGCYFSFPPGWTTADNDTIKVLNALARPERPTGASEQLGFYKIGLFNTTTKEYFFLTFPWVDRTEFLVPNQKRFLEEKPQSLRESLNYNIRTPTGVEVLDAKYRNEGQTASTHNLTVRTPVGMGYDANYQSPYNQDQDLQYILNSTYCVRAQGYRG